MTMNLRLFLLGVPSISARHMNEWTTAMYSFLFASLSISFILFPPLYWVMDENAGREGTNVNELGVFFFLPFFSLWTQRGYFHDNLVLLGWDE